MAEPKPITVTGLSCGHIVYTNGGKDAVANTGGTRYSAIEKAKTNAGKLCPSGVKEDYTIVSEGTVAMATIDDLDSHYEMNEKVMNATAGISGEKCYSVTLSITCADLDAYKTKLSAPQPVAPSQPSSPTPQIPRERGDGEVAPGTPPIGSGRKGPWKGIESL